MRIACGVAAVVFALFTYWQLNDLEQYGTRYFQLWIAAYGAVAIASLVSIWRPLPRGIVAAAAIAALVAAGIRASAIQWQDGPILFNEANPAGNETGGLLVTFLWLAVLAWWRSS